MLHSQAHLQFAQPDTRPKTAKELAYPKRTDRKTMQQK